MQKKSREIANAIFQIPIDSSVAIFSHIGVDGDCLGSALALKFTLEQIGVRSMIITNETVPEKFFYFPRISEIMVLPTSLDAKTFIESSFETQTIDYGILVDCSSSGRIGECKDVYESSVQKIILDHHYTSYCEDELCYIDPLACATGEIIYKIIHSLGEITKKNILTQDTATSLMASIMADTGGFRYSNTNKDAFEIAHDLYSHFPIDIRKLTYHLFEKTSISRIRLQGKAYQAAKFHDNNRIVACSIDQAMIEESNAQEGDVDGICSDLKNVEGTLVAFVLRQRISGEIRVNVRSSEEFDASSFSAFFGGGGHMRAAGFTLTGTTLEYAHRIVVDKAMDIIHQDIRRMQQL